MQDRVDAVIRGDLDVGDGGLKERELQIPEFVPVDDMCEKLNAEGGECSIDVVDSEFRIPAVVEMHCQRSQTELALHQIRHVRAVHTAADTDHAIKLPATTDFLDAGHERLQVLCRMPHKGLVLQAHEPVRAVVANANLVEPDVRIGGVHHTARANSMIGVGGHGVVATKAAGLRW